MLDPLLVAGASLLAGQLASQQPFPVATAALAALVLCRHHLRSRTRILALLAFALGTLRASSALQADNSSREFIRNTFGPPARCAGTVVVTSSPMRLGDRYALLARSQAMQCDSDGRIPPGTTLRLYVERDDLARGDRVDIVASLGVVELFRNPETAGATVAAARTGAQLSGGVLDVTRLSRPPWSPPNRVDRLRTLARRRIDRTYPADAAPMARALVLGESDLPESDAEAFRASGLSHLLAVSGTHIVIAVLGLLRILERVLVRVEHIAAAFDVGRLAACAGIPLAWVYAEFAGGGGSVRRAAWMTTAALAARALARRPDGVRAFALSLLAGGVSDSLAAFDVSFGLSAGATAGLLLLSRPLQEKLRSLPTALQYLAGPVAATISATAFCTPWLAHLAPSISFVGLAANLVAVPIGEAISLPACLAHLILSPVPPLERGLALLGSGSLLAVRAIARLGAQASFLALPVPRPTSWQLAALALGILAIILRRPRDRLLGTLLLAAALVLLEVAQVRLSQPKGLLRITVLDVGQGDSMLVDFPDGRAMLIDGGGIPSSPVDPGVRVVAPVLRERRRSRIDIAVLTHPHPDHVTGLASALPRIHVGAWWDNGYGSTVGAPPAYHALIRAMRDAHVPMRHPSSLCDRPLALGGATVEVLAPCPGVDSSLSANDNSYVLRLAWGRSSAMLMGDAEAAEEALILARRTEGLRSDLLKVGHHGSRTSSSGPWLDAVRPQVAVMTAGVRNRYGHPAPETLRALQARGIRVLRSDQNGAVVWESDGSQWRVTSWVQAKRLR